MRTTLPSVFISHGSPMIAIEPGAAGAFMQRLGATIDATFGRPRAIVTVSAHTAARVPVLLTADRHEAIHDFGNFDAELFTLRYDAPGAPELAAPTATLLQAAGIVPHLSSEGGLDHGAWTPLRYLYPEADVPVLPLAFVPTQTPAQQFALGRAIASLADGGVLVMGSGSMTHDLQRVFGRGRMSASTALEPADVAEFRAWMADRSAHRDWDALFAYRSQAPHAVAMHPTDEHLLPFYVAAGVGGPDAVPQRLHDGVTYGVLGMDAYAFGPGASALHEALDVTVPA